MKTIYLEGVRGELTKVRVLALVKREFISSNAIKVELLESANGYKKGDIVITYARWLVTNPRLKGFGIVVDQAELPDNLPTIKEA